MLCAMFSGRHELKPDGDDGAYFIDRDGKLFRAILDTIFVCHLTRCPDKKTRREDLLDEANFYQIQGIITQLKGNLTILSSLIKEESQASTIMSWLPPGASCTLLFRATTDGKNAAGFHRYSDNKGPTLVVTQSGSSIFGGYTSKSWSSPSSQTFIGDTGSFLFTLVNPTGNQAAKLDSNPDGGIRCSSDK
ncbi:unnamed protein product, partial [Porites evermanni]